MGKTYSVRNKKRGWINNKIKNAKRKHIHIKNKNRWDWYWWIRAELGDEPLSPIKCAKLFASSNADYKGNEYLDIFDSKYLKNKESKIEEAKVVEEKPKELSLIDKKIKVFEMLVKTSKGAKKDLLEKKINVFKMFRK